MVPSRQFRRQALVEGDRGGLARRVVDHVGRGGVAALRGDGHHHAVVLRHERRQELPREVVMRQRVDFEGVSGVRLGAGQDRAAGAQARVVDEDGGRAEPLANHRGHVRDRRRGGDIAREVMDVLLLGPCDAA